MHNVFEFDTIAECAGSRNDRILQVDAGEADAQIRIGGRSHGVSQAGSGKTLSEADFGKGTSLLVALRCRKCVRALAPEVRFCGLDEFFRSPLGVIAFLRQARLRAVSQNDAAVAAARVGLFPWLALVH